MATSGYGSTLKRATQGSATLVTGIVGNNNAILWTAVTEGTGGNSVSVTITNPGGTNPLAVSVTGVDVAIQAATSGGGIISTAAEVIAAVKADASVSAIVSVQNSSTSTGAGVVAAVTHTDLSGGSDTVTYTTIAEVKTIGGPSLKLNTVESTHLSSTNGWKEFIATLKETAGMSLGLNFLPADNTQSLILGLVKDARHRVLRGFRVTFTDTAATVWDFSAYVSDFDVTGMTPDGAIQATCNLRPSGAPTLA